MRAVDGMGQSCCLGASLCFGMIIAYSFEQTGVPMRLPAFLSLLLLSACCDGPLVLADCVGDSVTLSVVDENGEPVPVDSVRWVGAGSGLERCEEGMEDCSVWRLFGAHEGELEVTVVIDSVEHTEVFTVVRPEKSLDSCCGDVIQEQVELVVEG